MADSSPLQAGSMSATSEPMDDIGALRRRAAYLESMFDANRFPPINGQAWGVLGRLVILLYAPLGCLLVVWRLAVLMPLLSLLDVCCPVRWRGAMFRAYALVAFGFVVRVRGRPGQEGGKRARIVVANHLSELDALAMRAVIPGAMKTLGYAFYQRIWWLRFSPLGMLGPIFVPQKSRTEGAKEAQKKGEVDPQSGDAGGVKNEASAGRDRVRKAVRATIAADPDGHVPIVVFPEGGLTNGKVALLQYHRWMFSLGETVQPVALRHRGLLPIRINHMHATFAGNVFWFLFQPLHLYDVAWLDPQKAEDVLEGGDGASPAAALAQSTMTATAEALGVSASPFLYSDKRRHVKAKVALRQEGFRWRWGRVGEEKEDWARTPHLQVPTGLLSLEVKRRPPRDGTRSGAPAAAIAPEPEEGQDVRTRLEQRLLDAVR
jgi:ancient ubiquitous protein 1